jgi:hypothetical protein
VAQGRLALPAPLSLHVSDIPTPSRHIDLVHYADPTVLIAMFHSRSRLAGCNVYLGRLQHWLRDWKTANMSKNTAVLFVDAAELIQKPDNVVSRRVNTVGRNSSLSWGDPWYTAYTLDKRQRWKGRQLKHWECFAPSLTGGAAGLCSSASSWPALCWITCIGSGGPLPAAMSGSCDFYNPSAFALRLTHLGTLVKGKFTGIWEFIFPPTTTEH